MRRIQTWVCGVAALLCAGALWAEPLPTLSRDAREQLVSFARQVLSGEVTAVTPAMMLAFDPSLRAPAPEHLFITIFRDRAPAIRFTAQKAGLIEATFAAMGRARLLASFEFYHYDDARTVTLLVERVIDRRTIAPARWIVDLSFMDLGVEGIALHHDALTEVDSKTGKAVVHPARDGALPPGEVFLYGLQTRDDFILRLCSALKLFHKLPRVASPDTAIWDRARTRVDLLAFESFVSREAGDPVVGLYRMNDLSVEPWKDRLSIARWLGDALVAKQSADGAFAASYDPRLGAWSAEEPNVVDHCNAVFTLCDLSAATGDKRYLAAAGKGIAWLKGRFHSGKTPQGEPILFVVQDQEAKLGAAAMAVVALDRWASLSGSVFNDDDMKRLGKFLAFMQYDDGSFHHYYRWDLKAPFRERVSNSFPGQATWALALLEKRFGDASWGKAARKAAEYLVAKREQEMHWTETPTDPWLASALHELCTPFAMPAGVDYAKKMAEQALKRQKVAPADPDMVGSFEGEDEGSVNGAALTVRLWGEASAFVQVPADKASAQLEAMRRSLSFIRLNEVRPNNVFYLAEPEPAYGMVRAGAFNNEVRLDTTCYVIEALLWTDRAEKTRAENETRRVDPAK